MSEKEIIEGINKVLEIEKNTIHCSDGLYDFYRIIQGLLDLYNKEKEKNKKLTNTIKYIKEEKERNKELLNEKESIFDKGYLEGTRDGEEAIRDEIRGKIKELEEDDDTNELLFKLSSAEIRNIIRINLKELLEE